MSKFAKLFEVEDTQVLYIIENDDDGQPGVRALTSVDGVFFSVMSSFEDDEEETALAQAEEHFNRIGQEDAEKFHAVWVGLCK